MVSPSRLDLSLWPRRFPLPLKVERADLLTPPYEGLQGETWLTDPSLQWLSRCVGQSGTLHSTWGHCCLMQPGYHRIPAHSRRTWGGCSTSGPVMEKWSSKRRGKKSQQPFTEGAWWGSLMPLWESGRTSKVLSKQLSHNHKSYQHVLGTLRAWEPEVVLSVKIQPAKCLAPQTRRWFSHLENKDCGGAGEKTQPQGSRNIYSASSAPWKECIISEILLWWFFPENRIFYKVVCLQ